MDDQSGKIQPGKNTEIFLYSKTRQFKKINRKIRFTKKMAARRAKTVTRKWAGTALNVKGTVVNRTLNGGSL